LGSSRINAARTARSGQDKRGLAMLPAQDRHLVTQNEDLGVLRGGGSGQQREPAEHTAEDQVQQARRHSTPSSPDPTCHVAAGQRHIRILSPYRIRW
jgi:hypothetical protein